MFFVERKNMLRVYTTPNNFNNAKKAFSYRSQNPETITQDRIIEAIAKANTSITAADAVAVMQVLEDVFNKEISNGNVVELFMGKFYASASGTAEESDEVFRPAPGRDPRTPKRDHKITLHFAPKNAYKKMLQRIKITRMHISSLCTPVLNLIDFCGYPKKEHIEPGDLVVIKGNFIKLDPTDENQGVFFEHRDTHKTYRAKKYYRCTRITINAVLPEEAEPGIYWVKVINKEHLHSNSCQFVVYSPVAKNL